MKKIISVGFLTVLSLIAIGCKKDEVDYDQTIQNLSNSIRKSNSKDIKLYFNNDVEENEKVEIEKFTSIDNIELNENIIVVYDVEKETPSEEELALVKEKINDTTNLISVCFLGTKNYNYLDTIWDTNKSDPEIYENNNQISKCFSNKMKLINYYMGLTEANAGNKSKNLPVEMYNSVGLLYTIEKEINRL